MNPLSRLLAAQQRCARPDDGPLLLWQPREEVLKRVRAEGTGLPKALLGPEPGSVWLRLLGLDILVRCLHERTAYEIGQYFSESIQIAPNRSPDCIVECDWPTASRYLFRARPDSAPEELEGIRVQLPGDLGPLPWRSRQPPIPPLGSRILADRFVCLHAAALTHPTGETFLFIGERRSGKTTSSLHLTRRYGWTLLTDEAVFLLRRTRVVEPFPRSIGVAARIDQESGEMLDKAFVPANDLVPRIAKEPAFASYIVVLEPDPACGEPQFEILPASDALVHVLPHQIDVGTSADESFVTLLQLTEHCPSAVYRYKDPADLLALPQAIEKFWHLSSIRDGDPVRPDTLFQLDEGALSP